jgi:DNA invertase Pin-like site-specific DNA recombinase
MLGQLLSGDTVVVWKLDRLGRSLRDLIDLVADFKNRGIEFISLQDDINTATPTGRFTFNIFASASGIRAGDHQGKNQSRLRSSKSAGKEWGRPGGISSEAIVKAKSAKLLFDSGTKRGR